MTIVRTFATYSIQWDDRANWSGYDSREEAQAGIDFSVARGGRDGVVVEKVWDVEFEEGSALLEMSRRAGNAIAERVAV